MVNDYYVDDNSSTAMGKSESLFISCKTFKDDLTESEFRRNLDLAWRITHDFKSKKNNTAEEIKPVIDHGQAPCSNCGSDKMIRTGTCYTCICGTTSGCS